MNPSLITLENITQSEVYTWLWHNAAKSEPSVSDSVALHHIHLVPAQQHHQVQVWPVYEGWGKVYLPSKWLCQGQLCWVMLLSNNSIYFLLNIAMLYHYLVGCRTRQPTYFTFVKILILFVLKLNKITQKLANSKKNLVFKY